MSEQQPRRRSSDAAIVALTSEVRESREESRAQRLQMLRDIKCLAQGFHAFKEDWDSTYKPHLDAAITSEKDRREFIREKMRLWRSRAVDVAALFVVAVIAYSVTAADFWHKIAGKIKAMI